MASSDMTDVKIVSARQQDVPLVRILFREYADWLNVDLSFQHFEDELAALPGAYAPPDGDILLAWVLPGAGEAEHTALPGAAAGCVAVRRFDDSRCEMKRLWVRPAYRGRGIGRMLVDTIVDRARVSGYTTMLLDTLASMVPAYTLYVSRGFREIEAYYHNPLPDAVYLGREL